MVFNTFFDLINLENIYKISNIQNFLQEYTL